MRGGAQHGWWLAIEASNPSSGAAVAEGSEHGARVGDASSHGLGPTVAGVVAGGEARVERLRATGRHDDDLIPAIERLRARLEVSAGDLGLVAVSAGPGGYTALRVSIATAAAIAEAARVGVVLVPSSRVAVHGLDRAAFPALVCLASKRGSAHATRFRTSGDAGEVLGLVDQRDLGSARVRTIVADAFLPHEMAREAGRLGIGIEPPRFDARGVLALAASMEAVPPERAVPIYPREPEAVRRWLARRTS